MHGQGFLSSPLTQAAQGCTASLLWLLWQPVADKVPASVAFAASQAGMPQQGVLVPY